MKMGDFEKIFVNSPSHSRRVSLQAIKLLEYASPRPGQKYLDVGTGNGAAPIYIARTFGLDATGVDVDPDQIRIANDRSRGMQHVRFLTLDGAGLPFEDGEFDVVAASKVTHHVPAWRSLLQEMARVIKPGGYLILSDLVFPAAIAALGEKAAGGWMGFPTTRGLREFMQDNQFSTVHTSQSPIYFEGVFRKPGS